MSAVVEAKLDALDEKVSLMMEKLDMFFIVSSNAYKGNQALMAYDEMTKAPEGVYTKEHIDDAAQAFQYHSKVADVTMKYYHDVFGDEADLKIIDYSNALDAAEERDSCNSCN